jgi:hypothetical protein
MRTTRFILVLSPLVLLLPNVGNALLHSARGAKVAEVLYGWRVTCFPWNLMLAGLVYLYARHHRGGEAFWWAAGTAFAPYLVPLGLVFMPASRDSTSAMLRQVKPAPATTVSTPVTVPIEGRLPLLQRCLAEAPEETRAEQSSRFARVAANLEFSLWVETSAAERIAVEAASRDFSVWKSVGEAATHLYGAGRIPPGRCDATLDWLRKTSAPGQALRVSLREPDGSMRMTEYPTAGPARSGDPAAAPSK